MNDRYHFQYVECDAAEGVSLREWRNRHPKRRSTWSRIRGWLR